MIRLADKEKCSGCSACYNACRFGAITMKVDESGFWFPQINSEKCVNCGLCTKACSVIERINYDSHTPKAYIVQNKNDEIRRQSTSGGAFTSIARSVITRGGVVFGATIDDEYSVSHICVKNEDDLAGFRSSKYVQSKIGDTYKEAEKYLKEGVWVCFSGTPCQIYGLKKYLKKEYYNLLTVDVMCRAVPSPKVLQKYLDYQRKKYPKFDRIVFRDKGRGYSYSGVALYEGEKILYRGGSELDPWLRLFLQGYCNRETCHDCLYQTGARASDITMWDCWGTQNYAPTWDDNKGTTNLICWTDKGKEIVEKSKDVRIKEIGIQNIDASLERTKLPKPVYDRNAFFADCDNLSPDAFIKKYAPITLQVYLKSVIRGIMYKFHLHDAVRKIIHKIRKNNKDRK